MAKSAFVSERITALTTGGGAFALAGLVSVLNHVGFTFPEWAWIAYGCLLAALLLVCVATSMHMAWLWLEKRGLQLGPAIVIACGFAVVVAGVAWGAFAWRSPVPVHVAPQLLMRADLNDPMKFGAGPDARLKIILVNNGLQHVVVKDISLLVVDYRDDDRLASVHIGERLRELVSISSLKNPDVISFDGARTQQGGTIFHFTEYSPKAIMISGAPVSGSFNVAEDGVTEIETQFRVALPSPQESNVRLGAIVFDFVGRDGLIRRRICPTFHNIIVFMEERHGGGHGTAWGPIGPQPLVLLPANVDDVVCQPVSPR